MLRRVGKEELMTTQQVLNMEKAGQLEILRIGRMSFYDDDQLRKLAKTKKN
jgi:DNA-binding transcriptional regulator PaaX